MCGLLYSLGTSSRISVSGWAIFLQKHLNGDSQYFFYFKLIFSISNEYAFMKWKQEEDKSQKTHSRITTFWLILLIDPPPQKTPSK